ncbi:SPFH domain-containing protein [Victivallis sp. Marseille-Q1083]|uniref:SPFH domain-containing protein n=1 Tax=Victivallis sp. Marseille-Q1083 TaxID=2717288 RepID=UPI00158D7A89|nr:SPFH domain-containing protein [Victivallis sp. Marseille-Q1083]
MKNIKLISFVLFTAIATSLALTGCGPYPTEHAVEVKNHETAFVVPLEGDSKKDQAQFMSVEYLEKAKVATKRIIIPLRKRSTGRAWFDYEWIPLARVIVVDRSPVTCQWLEKDGIKVESLDSVGFTAGVNCTGMIKEEDAAKFLYYYPGNSLTEVMGKNVKGYIQNILAREFGSRDLSVCQKEKKDIVLELSKELTAHFAQYGITISSVGIADGMLYDNAEVQKTIDAVFVNETRVKQAEQEREAQKVINEKELSIAQNERAKAEEFAKAAEAQTKMIDLKIRQMEAEAKLEAARRWDGKAPGGVVPSNSPFLFQFGNK